MLLNSTSMLYQVMFSFETKSSSMSSEMTISRKTVDRVHMFLGQIKIQIIKIDYYFSSLQLNVLRIVLSQKTSLIVFVYAEDLIHSFHA
jgi:hypothetical protein